MSLSPSNSQSGAQRRSGKSLINQQIREAWNYYVAELDGFRRALMLARARFMPRRHLLMKVYESIMIDGHLQDCVTIRKDRVKAQPFSVVRAGTNERDPAATALLNTPWFDEFVDFALDALFWGYTVIELGAADEPPLQAGELTGVNVLPRAHVVPEERKMLYRESGTAGVIYTEQPHWDYVVEVGRPEELGLLQYAVVPTIFKKRANAAYDEFLNVFGKPNVYATYPSGLGEEELAKVDEFLESLIKSSWARFPEGTQLESLQSSSSSGTSMFKDRIDQLEQELTKLILQGTMLTDDGSSRSQAEVHERANLDTRDKDMHWLKGVINRKLIPRLVKLGYPLSGMELRWEQDIMTSELAERGEKESLSLSEKWQIDKGIVDAGYVIDPDYVAETYEVPITGMRQRGGGAPPAPGGGKGADGGSEDEDDPEQARRRAQLNAQAPPRAGWLQRQRTRLRLTMQRWQLMPQGPHDQLHTCCTTLQGQAQLPEPDLDDISGDEERFLRRIWAEEPDYDAARTQIAARALTEAVGEGWRTQVPSLDYTSTDWRTLWHFEANVWKFTAGRTLAELNQLNAAALDAQDFADFQERARRITGRSLEHLKTEYKHAWSASRGAARYQEMQREAEDGDFTYWEYQTAGDSRVRAEHERLDGTVQRYDSSFWDTYYPPNGWNCRCDVISVDQDAVDPEKLERSNKMVTEGDLPELARGFERNPKQTQRLFSQNQQYVRDANLSKTLGIRKNSLKKLGALPKREQPVDDKADAAFDVARGRDWFNNNDNKGQSPDGQEVVFFQDYRGRPLMLSRQSFEEHVGKTTKGGRARAPYIPLIEDALQDPDEVYLQEQSGAQESQPRIIFFQFYQDMPFKVITKLTNEGVYILSWHPLDDKLGEQGFGDSINGQRYGILMFHKQKNAR